jgi:hypothetical protein
MIKDILQAIGSATRKLFAHWGTTLITLVLYLLLLSVLYTFFFATGVGTVTHVILSLVVLPLAALVLFFVLQGLGVSYVRIGVGPGYLLRRAFKDCWSLLLVSVPLVLLGCLDAWGSDKLKARLGYEQSKEWLRTLLWWARFVLLYIVLPLLAVHLWIAAAREGARGAYRGFLRNAAYAFAPRSLAIYALLYTIFSVVVYVLLFTKTQFGGAWVELTLLGGRIALALLLVFVGWLVTLGALAEVTARSVKLEAERADNVEVS